LIGVYKSFDEINFDILPEQFVLKCTHDSGGLIICKDKENLDVKAAKRKIEKSLKKNYYYATREWPYKNIKPRIICEKYMVDESGTGLKDYKFLCFHGVPKALLVVSNREISTKSDFFDLNFNQLPVRHHYENARNIEKPKGFEEMVELAKKLSKGIIHVRTDFYDIHGKIYFGEMTFYQFGGFRRFEPQKYDMIFGRWIKLPRKKVKK
jgi:hypothetical protein